MQDPQVIKAREQTKQLMRNLTLSWSMKPIEEKDIEVFDMLNDLWSKKRFGYSLPQDIQRFSDEAE
jgi:hypothetical protein